MAVKIPWDSQSFIRDDSWYIESHSMVTELSRAYLQWQSRKVKQILYPREQTTAKALKEYHMGTATYRVVVEDIQ